MDTNETGISFKKIYFRLIDLLVIVAMLALGIWAGWQGFFLKDLFGALATFGTIIGVVFLLTACQQLILWLLPKKERNFWQKN